MEIPKPISEFIKRYNWITVLIFGIFIGFVSSQFISNKEIDVLKTLLHSKDELIVEYRERLQIHEKNEGPYHFYTDRELKDRAIELSRKIEKLCEQNALLSIGEYYQQTYNEYKRNESSASERLSPPWLLLIGSSKEIYAAQEKIAPPITQDDIGRTYGELLEVWMQNISRAIEPEVKSYKKEYIKDVVNIKEEMLFRMSPRAWRQYRLHVDPQNPGRYLIGVAIQLREIANDLIR